MIRWVGDYCKLCPSSSSQPHWLTNISAVSAGIFFLKIDRMGGDAYEWWHSVCNITNFSHEKRNSRNVQELCIQKLLFLAHIPKSKRSLSAIDMTFKCLVIFLAIWTLASPILAVGFIEESFFFSRVFF